MENELSDKLRNETEEFQGGKKRTCKTVKKGGKRKGNEWTKLVTKTYKTNHKRNKDYTFKQAIKDSRKLYKKGGNQQNQENQNQENQNQEQEEEEENEEQGPLLGGKRKSKKNSKKENKKSRKNKLKYGGNDENKEIDAEYKEIGGGEEEELTPTPKSG